MMSIDTIILIGGFAVNAVAFFWLRGNPMRWISFAAAFIPLALMVAVLISNAAAGCYPWSPKTIEYAQGMTICPGQSAIVTIGILPAREPGKDI